MPARRSTAPAITPISTPRFIATFPFRVLDDSDIVSLIGVVVVAVEVVAVIMILVETDVIVRFVVVRIAVV